MFVFSPAVFKWKNLNLIVISIVLLILNLCLIWLWLNFLTLKFQRYLMYLGYLPLDSRRVVNEPPTDGLGGGVDSFYLKGEDGIKLHVHFYYYKPDHEESFTAISDRTAGKTSFPTILFFHGTSGNIGHRIEYVKTLSGMCGCNVMLMNCRGYGLSDGSSGDAHRKGIQADSQVGLDYLLNLPSSSSYKIDKSKIFVLGQSMGGAIAIDLAMRNLGKIKGMIIDNTFTTMKSLLPEVLPPFSHLSHYITEDWDSLGAIENSIKKDPSAFPHCIFLIGLSDELISPQHGIKLYEAASKVNTVHNLEKENASTQIIQKEIRMFTFKYGYHVHTFRDPFYFDSICQFVNEVSNVK